MMRKIFFGILIAGAAIVYASCDTKSCYCYETDASGRVHEQVVYAKPSTACNSYSTASRGCVESNERGSFDPNQVAK